MTAGKLLAVIDSDPNSKKVRERFIRECEGKGIKTFRLSKYAIENYFPLDSIRKVSPTVSEAIKLDDSIKLENQIGINVKKRNAALAKHTDLAHYKSTDISKFVDLIQSVLQK